MLEVVIVVFFLDIIFMSYFLSYYSIKRVEEISFYWNINLLKIVCNIIE